MYINGINANGSSYLIVLLGKTLLLITLEFLYINKKNYIFKYIFKFVIQLV